MMDLAYPEQNYKWNYLRKNDLINKEKININFKKKKKVKNAREKKYYFLGEFFVKIFRKGRQVKFFFWKNPPYSPQTQSSWCWPRYNFRRSFLNFFFFFTKISLTLLANMQNTRGTTKYRIERQFWNNTAFVLVRNSVSRTRGDEALTFCILTFI